MCGYERGGEGGRATCPKRCDTSSASALLDLLDHLVLALLVILVLLVLLVLLVPLALLVLLVLLVLVPFHALPLAVVPKASKGGSLPQ